MGKVFLMILAVFLLLGAFASPINDGIKGWRTEDTTESFVAATGAGVTTANVTLGSELFQDGVSEVIAITSNITETPVATSYVSASQVLLVSALDAGTSRTLSVNYYADSDSSIMQVAGPFFGIFIFGGLLVAIFLGMNKK